MSFKREGDDLSLLNKLKHQRVSELLATHIPEDEAKILSNGKLTCLICSFRPIFDTMSILANHRQGKKHLLELSKYIKRKQELEFENVKRLQKEALRDEAIEASLKSKTLGIKESNTFDSFGSPVPSMRKKVLEVPHLLCFGPQLPSLITKSTEKSPTCQLRRYLKDLHRKPSLGKLLEIQKESYLQRAQNNENKFETKQNEEVLHEEKKSPTQNCNEKTEDFSRHLSGWIKNKDGTWSKDPNAEFDSDDDQPLQQPDGDQ